MTDIPLRILLSAQDTASKIISGFGSQLLKLSGDFKPLLIGAAVVGGAVIGIGVKAVQMASQFQTAILSLVAHAGLAQSQVQNVTNAVLAMAPAVGRSPIELADALYPIFSAFSGITDQGAKTAVALATLKLSFEAVAGTTTNGTDVAKAAIGTFNALGMATNNAATNTQRMTGLMDIMDKTVQLGNMQWDDYKNVISKLAISIQGTGVSFNEASASLAEMTNEGFSAQKAQTYLSNTFNTLAIKTDALAKHAKTLGISFNETKYASMDWADKLKYLNEITDGNKQKLLALMGGNSTALKTFNALTVGVKGYQSNLDALGHSQGALQSSFDTASKGFAFAMSQVKAGIDSLLIQIGTPLLQGLTQVAQAIVPIIAWVMNFTSAVGQNQVAMDAIKSVLLALAGVILGVLINALVAWAAAMIPVVIEWLAMAWPILLIGLIAAAVIFGIMQLVRHWGAVMAWLKGVWDVVSKAIGAAFSWLGDHVHGIISAIGGFFSGLGTKVHIFFVAWQIFLTAAGAKFEQFGLFIHSIIKKIGDVFSGLGTLVHGVWDGIVGAIKGAINFIIGIINGFIGGIDKIHISAGPIQIGFNIPKIPYLDTGGYIETGGIAMVHPGETVTPARISPFGGGAGGQAVNMYVTINGPSRQMADQFLQEVSRKLKQQGVLVTWTSGGRAT